RERNGEWRARIEAGVADWWELLERRAHLDADPVNPQRVFWELSRRLPDRCILTGDSGSGTNWFARDLKIREGMMASLSGGLATMGCGVPYGVAAKFAFPGRPVIALVGDGAMQMLGINGLITIAKYWEEWSDPRFVVCVLNNRDLNQVTWEQRVFNGDPKYSASQNLPAFDYAAYARSLGLAGFRVDRPGDLESGWDRALSADRPAVLDVVTDPDVPPLPPHITIEQARQYLSSMLRGEPGALSILKRSLKEMAAEWLPVGGD
ncbi:MAG TPA: thiamine pyrophosphate-dependent enzyme, partial [bacterium]|nr:thiamine pyrophosphate-dependent enzyme [bacterium]